VKRSEYAKRVGITSKTASQRWKAGQVDASQLSTGTLIVREPKPAATGAALDARVSSADSEGRPHPSDAAAARLRGGARPSGGGRGDRDRLWAQRRAAHAQAAADQSAGGVLVVEHRDRLTRVGSSSIATLLAHQGRRVEAVFPTGTSDDLVDDFVAVITSLAARISGRRTAKRRAAHIQACVRKCIERAEVVDSE
jgi:predicted site-specific integrase-resolvase